MVHSSTSLPREHSFSDPCNSQAEAQNLFFCLTSPGRDQIFSYLEFSDICKFSQTCQLALHVKNGYFQHLNKTPDQTLRPLNYRLAYPHLFVTKRGDLDYLGLIGIEKILFIQNDRFQNKIFTPLPSDIFDFLIDPFLVEAGKASKDSEFMRKLNITMLLKQLARCNGKDQKWENLKLNLYLGDDPDLRKSFEGILERRNKPCRGIRC